MATAVGDSSTSILLLIDDNLALPDNYSATLFGSTPTVSVGWKMRGHVLRHQPKLERTRAIAVAIKDTHVFTLYQVPVTLEVVEELRILLWTSRSAGEFIQKARERGFLSRASAVSPVPETITSAKGTTFATTFGGARPSVSGAPIQNRTRSHGVPLAVAGR